MEKSFRTTQLPAPTFYLPKEKLVMSVDKHCQEKAFVPGVGFYNTENLYRKTTRGLAKGWK